MKKPLKWSLIILLLLIIAGYSVYNGLKPLTVELIYVQPQALTDILTEEGYVKAMNEIQVSSQIGGKLEQLTVHEGDRVKKGALLFALNTRDLEYQLADLSGQLSSISGQAASAYLPPYSSQIKQQELAIEQAKKQLETAEKELQRAETLFTANAVSKESYEQTVDNVQERKNYLAQQEAALNLLKEQSRTPVGMREQYAGTKQSIQARMAQLRNQLKNGQVYAPMDGYVKQIDFKLGANLMAGANVLTLVAPDNWYVDVLLLQEDIPNIKPGMKTTITQKRKNQDEQISGKVTSISRIAQETVSPLGIKERRVELHVQPDQRPASFLIGTAVDVGFPIHTEQQKLILPKTSLFPYADGDAVWIVQDGKAVVQPVKKGYETAEDVAIEEGLKPGDAVIRNPQTEGLKEGVRVVE